MRLEDPNSSGTYYGKDIRACGTMEEIWTLRVQIGENADPEQSGYYPELSWDPYTLSITGNFSLWSGASGEPATQLADMRQTDHYQIKPEDGEYFYIHYTYMPIEICEGDFDSDGDVDGSNLVVFAQDFGRTDCAIGPPCEGDFDNDGDVDGSDLVIFVEDFGRTDCL